MPAGSSTPHSAIIRRDATAVWLVISHRAEAYSLVRSQHEPDPKGAGEEGGAMPSFLTPALP
jgi:hypothetical protein